MTTTTKHVMFLAVMIASAGLALTACNTRDAKPAGSVTDSRDADASESEFVKVARDGSRFDPAVPVDRVPQGAWMCDMGDVHYASLDQGDGKCPVCGMKLKQQTQGVEQAEHDHDHEH